MNFGGGHNVAHNKGERDQERKLNSNREERGPDLLVDTCGVIWGLGDWRRLREDRGHSHLNMSKGTTVTGMLERVTLQSSHNVLFPMVPCAELSVYDVCSETMIVT